MPVAIVVRILARLAIMGALRRLSRRAQARAGSAYPRGTVPRSMAPGAWEERRREAAGILAVVARTVAGVVLLAGAGTLLAAGGTLTGLGPRWVGIPLLVLAVLALAAAAAELHAAWTLRLAQVRRSRDRRLRSG